MTVAWLAVPALIVLIVVASEYRRRWLRTTRTRRAISGWQTAAVEDRVKVLEALVAEDYRAATAWYLLGCLAARRHDFATAARLFGMAHHVDADLTSAAVLTFACLKAAGDPRADDRAASRALAQTWSEMRKPMVGQSALEQTVLRVIQPGEPAASDRPPLERLAALISDAPA